MTTNFIDYQAEGTLVSATLVEDPYGTKLFVILVDLTKLAIRVGRTKLEAEFVVSTYWNGFENWNSYTCYPNVVDAFEKYNGIVAEYTNPVWRISSQASP